jgi:hypothetical protein
MRGVLFVELVHVGSGIEEAFRAQEESCSTALVERQTQCSDERIDRVIAFGAVVLEVPRAAFPSEAIVDRDGLDQRRFSGSILTGEKADSRLQREFVKTSYGGYREWITLPILDSLGQKFDFFEHDVPRFADEIV